MAIKSTPLITQYLSVKQRVPDAILFFRLGDFYEMFFEDAEVGARVLDIQLTSRSKDGVPLCGVPYHAAEPYIAKLLKAGLKVAICEQGAADMAPIGSSLKGAAFQLTAPGAGRGGGRGLMPRQIVRVITPGTVGEETVLTADEKSFLLALAPAGDGFALAALDVSTGEFVATRLIGLASVREEIARIAPREILAPKESPRLAVVLAGVKYPLTELDGGCFAPQQARETLARHFGVLETASADGALDDTLAAAAGAALAYVEENFGRDLAHLRPPRVYRAAEY
ncbi:MAG: DNA mismatch repair protein MutS, partial [Candidatus Binataceae bacterium]